MVQNIVDASSMQEAMKKLQLWTGEVFSNSGSGKPRFVSIIESDNGN
tara:strand:- start:815 stop:955 length:141 start_codon:yes stop_codon:yes gene_type:complete